MLSHNYRIRIEKIAEKIARGEEVSLDEMIWANKLSSHNAHAGKIMRQARRKLENPDMKEGDLDDFLNQLDIGGLGNERYGVGGFNSADEIADFFKRDEDENPEERRRRD
jgi:hypothetical protein